MIPAPARGEGITAAFLQSLSARIERLERNGVDPVAAVFAALPSDEFVQCRIVKRRFMGDPIADDAEPAEVPSAFTYDIRGVRRNLVRTGLTPIYGREVRSDECRVYPALVGQVCYFVRSPGGGGGGLQGELMLLPGCEVPARRRCESANVFGGPIGGATPEEPAITPMIPPTQAPAGLPAGFGGGSFGLSGAGGAPGTLAGESEGDGGGKS